MDNEYQKKQMGEDTKAHERLGLRINDKQADPTDINKDGQINENDQQDVWG